MSEKGLFNRIAEWVSDVFGNKEKKKPDADTEKTPYQKTYINKETEYQNEDVNDTYIRIKSHRIKGIHKQKQN